MNLLEPDSGLQSIDSGITELEKLHKSVEDRGVVDDFDLQKIGSMLPDDEEELLAGIVDDFDLSGLPSQVEELEEYDVFGIGGGMELDFDPSESLSIGMAKTSIGDGFVGNGTGQYGVPHNVGTIFGEHPYGEHPSRTLFVRNINSNVEDSELRTLFEVNYCSDKVYCSYMYSFCYTPSVEIDLFILYTHEGICIASHLPSGFDSHDTDGWNQWVLPISCFLASYQFLH